jgi:hypothetical protein
MLTIFMLEGGPKMLDGPESDTFLDSAEEDLFDESDDGHEEVDDEWH